MLSDSEKIFLVSAARRAIEAAVKKQRSDRPASVPPSLMSNGAAFVTLYLDDQLRGCIGSLEARIPLVDTVMEVAAKAAKEDPRFYPLSAAELPIVTLEISVLSPLKQITSIDEIIIGTHGLVFEWGYARGVFLPQVPVEQGWDKETYLRETAMKAGCPPDSWKKSGAKLFVFTCEVFGDESE